MTRVAVLVSGRGSNLAALLRAAEAGAMPARIAAVLSNVPEAPALELARARGIPALVSDHRPFGRDRAGHETAVLAALARHEIEVICLAGYLRILAGPLLATFAGRILNIHPSLLPAFPGLDTHAQALAAGVRLHGCTVHLVTEALDAGPILAQAAVPVLPGDTPDRLAARVLLAEHDLYPAALGIFLGEHGALPAMDARLANPLPLALPAA